MNLKTGLLVITLLTSALNTFGQSFACDDVNIKVITDPHTMYIGCKKNWPSTNPLVTVYEFNDDKSTDPSNWIVKINGQTVTASFFSPRVLQLTIQPALEAQKRYLVVLKSTSSPAQSADLIVQLSTEGKAKVNSSLAGLDLGRKFTVTSDVDISTATTKELDEKPEKNDPNVTHHDARVKLAAQQPGGYGKAQVELSHGAVIRAEEPFIVVPGLTDAFGQTITAENAVKLGAPPKGKDDANQFYQISHQAGRGSKPALALNIKSNAIPFLRRSSFWAGNFLVQPDILIDIATNALAKNSDDTIRLGFSATRTRLFEDTAGFVQGYSFSAGPGYETNRKFEKRNLIVSAEFHPILRSFVNTREMRRFEAMGRTGQDIPQSQFKAGYGFEFFVGFETGGSLRSQVFKSEDEKSQINLPKYSIFRFRPRVHMFFEFDRFTIDVSDSFRVLATPEYVGEEFPEGFARQRRVNGIQNYAEITTSYGLDAAKHVSFAVTYKRGAQPPLFPHVNAFVSGFTIKY